MKLIVLDNLFVHKNQLVYHYYYLHLQNSIGFKYFLFDSFNDNNIRCNSQIILISLQSIDNILCLKYYYHMDHMYYMYHY